MEKVKGYIDHIIYQNRDNGYAVLSFITEGEELVCVGSFKNVESGETLEIEGDFVEHPVYGSQLKAAGFRVVPPDDAASMERYLGSGAIKGIGEALAARIVRKFGEDTFRIMEEEPERLSEVKGISERKAREIAAQIIEKKDMREAFVFLQQYGISNTLAVRIYNQYGMNLYGIMKENPYRLAEDISGVGFRIADEIASKIGIHTDSDYRIRSGILYALLQASAEGHIYLPADLLSERSAMLLGLHREAVEPQIDNLAMDKKLVIKMNGGEKRVYASSYYYAELKCARMLHDLNVSMDKEMLPAEEGKLEALLKAMETEQGIMLDELQKKAVLTSITSGIMILSGGPGTGKTTTINTIIRYFEKEGMDILLAAPTGRAAKRMTETTGFEARTIHRLLEVNGSAQEERTAQFERNEENPLEADVLIIDEMSMVDIHLFQSLLCAVSVGTRLVMVGDRNQLPSVGPGQVLQDLIGSGSFPVVVLKKIFRQAGESDIVVNAHKINRGEPISLDNKSRDFFLLERNDVNVIYKHMIQLIREKLPRYVEAQPYDIQVLTPMRKGNLGVEALNVILQKYLNPPSPDKREYQSGERLFREGDKVMQVKNNYQLAWEILSRYGIPVDKGMGVFNGDMGIVCEINEAAQSLCVEYDEHRRVEYAFTQLDEIELAYAVTIHKSQGSEYPAVILPLLSGPKLLFNRNLLYTAVTRARKCVTILGSARVVQEMIDNERESRRYTSLGDRIRELVQVWE
ncbi:MAG: ATP-dependent RecD-like DNA helicase [Lachnospiraceae bacterium]|mgnify:FL=1|jgi:exodeoxyribonuclease V alpha subunit|nr:ATP-dependent RecD-like DNA helicase [Lachnospiraceae bacterium]